MIELCSQPAILSRFVKRVLHHLLVVIEDLLSRALGVNHERLPVGLPKVSSKLVFEIAQ